MPIMTEASPEDVQLDYLDEFLMSDRSPENCMQLPDLDGFLTGIAIGPELIKPSEWLPVVWGGEEPDFTDIQEAQAVLNAIMGRYNEILTTLRESPEEFDPILMETADGQVIAADWAAGFLDAIELRPQAWQPMLKSDVGHRYVTPIVLLASSEEELPEGLRAGLADSDILQHLHELIPQSVRAIDGYWKRKRGVTTSAGSVKAGRNDPCPCRSGKKYKKCCGAN